MHKFISTIISLLLILPLFACGANGNAVENDGAAAKAETGINGEISVSAYDAMTYKAFLEDAAMLFEEKYPGVTVNVETFSTMPEIKRAEQGGNNMILADYQDDPQGKQDYINTVNTALMGGGGADILAMDVLPFYKYAETGQLENLADYMRGDPEFNKADYQANVLEAVAYENGTWFLPADYTFNYYAYDSSLITGGAASGFGIDGSFTVEELIALAGPYFSGTAKILNKPEYARGLGGCVWDSVLEENYTYFVNIENKTANFNDGKFENLLEATKKYSKNGYIPTGAAGQSDAGRTTQMPREGAADPVFFKPKSAFSLISFYTRNLGMPMSSMGEGDSMAIGDNDEIAGIAAGADGSIPFTCNQAYGLNSNSANKETAWAFLKFLLSEEVQQGVGLSSASLPVLNSAREKKMEIMLASMMEQQGQTLNEAQLEAAAKYNETVARLSDRIDAYVIKDALIDDMIAAEVRYFFEGAKTAAEVADVLQNKVGLYLNE